MTRALALAAALTLTAPSGAPDGAPDGAALPSGTITLDPSEGEGFSDLAYHTSAGVVRAAREARLAYLVLDDVPWARDGGTRKWDLATGPDLELVVRGPDGREVAESRGPAAADVAPGDFPLAFEVTGGPAVPVGARLALYVSDHDRTGSDLMFRTAPFTAASARRAGRVTVPVRTWTGTRVGTAYFEFAGWGP